MGLSKAQGLEMGQIRREVPGQTVVPPNDPIAPQGRD